MNGSTAAWIADHWFAVSRLERNVEPAKELFGLAEKLEHSCKAGSLTDLVAPLDAVEAAANRIKKAFSGSWLGYHSRVYYADLVAPPPGVNFSKEWGLKE